MSKFDTIIACGMTAIVGVAIGINLDKQKDEKPPVEQPTKAQAPVELTDEITPEPPVELPTTPPVIWHDNLASALLDHEANGGMLAVIIGGEGCEPCKRRLAEAKALQSSPYQWVYCLNDDPALAWMDLSEEEVKTVPMFVTVIGPVVDHRVKPETLGLKQEIPQ